jgi:hypothetical protein
VVLTRGQGGFAAIFVTLATCVLVVLDVNDAGLRRWWAGHALTTDTVAGLLVLLITVLVVDQVVGRRQFNDRARAIGAQAAIVLAQANRASRAMSEALTGAGGRDAASDEFRTYMMMLLVAAPVLIDARVSRTFLEQAQALGGELARVLTQARKTPDQSHPSTARLDAAVKGLRAASDPLFQIFDPDTRAALVGAEDRP